MSILRGINKFLFLIGSGVIQLFLLVYGCEEKESKIDALDVGIDFRDVEVETTEENPYEILIDLTEEDDTKSDATDVTDDGTEIPWPEGSTITTSEVYRRMSEGDSEMLLLNVSDEEFYYLGHIPGSLVIPWDILPDHLDLVNPSLHIVIYCRRGVRSESAYTTLKNASYPYLWIMEGGLEAWIAAGYPTVSCDDPSVTCPFI